MLTCHERRRFRYHHLMGRWEDRDIARVLPTGVPAPHHGSHLQLFKGSRNTMHIMYDSRPESSLDALHSPNKAKEVTEGIRGDARRPVY